LQQKLERINQQQLEEQRRMERNTDEAKELLRNMGALKRAELN
jgi:hypothetical protein